MSAPREVGLAADAEALNLADEVRRILADGQPRTTRQIADLSSLTQGGDDVSKAVYQLRRRGEVQTDVVDGQRLHRLIPGGGPPPREPARPRPVPVAAAAPPAAAPELAPEPRWAAAQRYARQRAAIDRPIPAAAPAAPLPADPAAAPPIFLSITDRGQLHMAGGQAGEDELTLDADQVRRLHAFLAATAALFEAAP